MGHVPEGGLVIVIGLDPVFLCLNEVKRMVKSLFGENLLMVIWVDCRL
jgi:hypothetical protein